MIEAIKGVVADLARPAAIWIMAGACGWGLLAVSVPSDKLGLALTALGAMYAAKAAENASAGRHAASVQVAQAQANGPPLTSPTVNVENANTVTAP